ncbi:glucosyltransferase domain-containing protein [Paenibacillus tritici]|uniref:Glucosyltransferase domain-containing protein n=1 Tax=Paenibacillus tritici TaxID=1873425 RepID=A0ABX2DRI0_9BACL|nr:glucosyltransferase domain-containing protein [Paenibacillus tritici]NQX47277.1 glucosyltransferase domain-containing protein [Paenibacillus tritici]
MSKKSFASLRLWGFLIGGMIILYCGLSYIISGRIVVEAPSLSNQISISKNQLYSGLKDFERHGDILTSKSSDPWITVELTRMKTIKEVKIELTSLSKENTNAQIYYATGKDNFSGEQHYNMTLKNGENSVVFTKELRLKSLRLDLTDAPGVSAVIANVKIVFHNDVLWFWITFFFVAVVYLITVFRSYFLNNEMNRETVKNSSGLYEKTIAFFDRKELILLISSFLIAILYYLPYITNTLYSIDDYYLNQLYSINIDTLGYNFHSTGRYLEAVLAQIFYYMNIQPLTKPLGPIIFIGSMSILGVFFTRMLKIESFIVSLSFVLIFTTNPFISEIFHYSIIPAYSAFAIIALTLGVIFGEKYVRQPNPYFLILSIIGYVCSLTIYQIFFPIVFLVFIYKLLVPVDPDKNILGNSKRNFFKLCPLIIYFLSFIVYTVGLKISFYIWPPTLAYSGNNIGELIQNIFTSEYWNKIFNNLSIYIFNDNPFNSGKINIVLLIIFLSTLILYVVKKGASNQVPAKELILVFFSFILIPFLGLFANLGFSLLRPVEISSRSFTSFGIFQGILVLLSFDILKKTTKQLTFRRIVISFLVSLVLFSNMGRIGRVALDQYRLNTLERSLVTRIVSRIEINKNFSQTAKLIIVGSPAIGNLENTTWADYNIPAIRQFSKIFLFNEVTGYNFQIPSTEDVEKASSYLESMEAWPSYNSIKFIDGSFVIKLP